MSIDRIRLIAEATRDFLNDRYSTSGIWGFDFFPAGSCTWATVLLGEYLQDVAGYSCLRVKARREYRGDEEGHEWVLVDDIDVDVTPDQFKDCKQPVIVARNSAWHHQWNTDRKTGVISLRSDPVDPELCEKLAKMYAELTAYLKQHIE